jgi:hypothetical protein
LAYFLFVEPPVDLTKLPGPAQKILDANGPAPLKQMAARGVAPGLKPGDAITVVALLAESPDLALAETARATLKKLPAPVLNGALSGDLPPGVIDAVAPLYATEVPVMERMLALPSILMSTVAKCAKVANEAVSELIATNEQRLLANPEIIEQLYLNKNTRMSTADRIVELAVRNNIELKGIPAFKETAAAIGQVLIAEPSAEPNFSDTLFSESLVEADQIAHDPADEDTHELDPETGEEVVKEQFKKSAKKYGDMTISEKIRAATIGNATIRALAVRDSNRLVCEAAIQSPAINENEVVRISSSRNVSDGVLRIIANNKEWTRSHQIKFNLVENPRTPFVFASRLINHLREHELKALARSKNVTGAVATAAKQALERKSKKGG